jgi:hypothetical protein
MRYIVKIQTSRSLPVIDSPIGIVDGIDEVGDLLSVWRLARYSHQLPRTCLSTRNAIKPISEDVMLSDGI